MLAFSNVYFRPHFYFRFASLSSAKRKSVSSAKMLAVLVAGEQSRGRIDDGKHTARTPFVPRTEAHPASSRHNRLDNLEK